jgi:hypothetical protein
VAAYPQADTPTTRQVFGTDYREDILKALNAEEASLRKRAWDLEHRLEAVGSKDAKIIRDLLDKLAEYHRMLYHGVKNTEQANQPDTEQPTTEEE